MIEKRPAMPITRVTRGKIEAQRHTLAAAPTIYSKGVNRGPRRGV